MPTGGAAYTPASLRPHQYIIHTVWPVFNFGSPRSVERLVHSTVISLLDMAAYLKVSSVAMPALPSTVKGLTKEAYNQIMLETSLKWAQRHKGSVKHIWFCAEEAVRIQVYKKLLKRLKERFGVGTMPEQLEKIINGQKSLRAAASRSPKRRASYTDMTLGFANKAQSPGKVSTPKPVIDLDAKTGKRVIH